MHEDTKSRLNAGNACYHWMFCISVCWCETQIKMYTAAGLILNCFVWVGNLVCHIKRRTQAKGVREYGAEGGIGTKGEEVTRD